MKIYPASKALRQTTQILPYWEIKPIIENFLLKLVHILLWQIHLGCWQAPSEMNKPTSVVCWWSLQTDWTQIRPNKMSGLIWIRTVWHSDGIPEGIFRKSWYKKNQQTTKKNMKNYPVGNELSRSADEMESSIYLYWTSLLCFVIKFVKTFVIRMANPLIVAFWPQSLSAIAFNILHAGWFFIMFCCLLYFFENKCFQKTLSGIPPGCRYSGSKSSLTICQSWSWS